MNDARHGLEQVMPHHRSLEKTSLWSGAIEAMAIALEDACRSLGLDERADPLRDLLTRTIIEIAGKGERNPKRLCERTLSALRITGHNGPVYGLDCDHPNGFLARLPADDLRILSPCLRKIVLEPGAALHGSDDDIQDVLFPHSGLISLTVQMKNGTKAETATVGREGAYGIMAGLGHRRAFGQGVVQLPGVASRLSVRQFSVAAQQSSSLRRFALAYISFSMAQIEQIAACNALHELDARVCRWLLQAHDRIDGQRLALTQDFVAQMNGVRRSSVTLAYRALQEAGIIRCRRGAVEIVDRERLELRSCECYAVMRSEYGKIHG